MITNHMKHLYILFGLCLCLSTIVYATDEKYPEDNSNPEEKEKYFTNPPTPLFNCGDKISSQSDHSENIDIIKNPLVLLVAAADYTPMAYHKQKNIATTHPSVVEDMYSLYDLFKRKCGYDVISTFFDQEGNILPRHAANEQKMDGKWLYEHKLAKWLDTQASYLAAHSAYYDGLIFVFISCGFIDQDGRLSMVTSDNKCLLFEKIAEVFLSDHQLKVNFKGKTKLFFQFSSPIYLMQANSPQKSITLRNAREFICYPQIGSNASYCYAPKDYGRRMFRAFQRAIQEKYPLTWINRALNIILTSSSDSSKEGLLFAKKGKGTFFSLPATNNLPTLPQDDRYVMNSATALQEIFDLFVHKKITKQALIADSGQGKNTLARLYARKYFTQKGHYAHVWWFNARDKAALAASIEGVHKTMGLVANDHENMRQKMDRIEEKLATCPRWLLIFDNVGDPSELLGDYLPKNTLGGHILITSCYNEKKIWVKYAIFPKRIKHIVLAEAQKFLSCFHMPQSPSEKKALAQLCQQVNLNPLALNLIGYHLYQAKQDRLSAQESTEALYQDYLALYEKELASYKSSHSPIAPAIVITFITTSQKIAAKINAITLKESKALRKAWHLLQVISFLHPDGLDWFFFNYLVPSRKLSKKGSTSRRTFAQATTRKAILSLSAYGLLMAAQEKLRVHQSIQHIMRMSMMFKKTSSPIQEEALQLLEAMQRRTFMDVELLRLEMTAHCNTLMHYIQYDPKQRIRLLSLMSRIDSQAYLRPVLYFSLQATDYELLDKQVFRFIDSNAPLLLLTGNAASGKSTYGCQLVEKLWERYKENSQALFGYLSQKAYIPLFISLPAYCKPRMTFPYDLITNVLLSKGLTIATIKKMQKAAQANKQAWLFFLDGYDEIYAAYNIFEAFHLADWGVQSSKYIITCRKEYLEILKAQGKTLKELFTVDQNELQTLTIGDFGMWGVKMYIQTFALSAYNERKDNGWDNTRYQQVLQQFPEVNHWMSNPFWLVVGVQLLPELYETLDNITLKDICEAFISAWIAREVRKPYAKITSKSLQTFCEKIAYSLFLSDKYLFYKNDVITQPASPELIQLQSAPLYHPPKKESGHYAFIHTSIQDFFAAAAIVKQQNLCYILENRPLRLNNTIISFLLARITIDDSLRTKLWGYIRATRKEKASPFAAHNSVKILCSEGPKDFSGENFTYLNLEEIDLTKTQLPRNLFYTNLSRAKLPKDLSKHDLTHTNLSYTDLIDVRLPKDLFHTNLKNAKLPKNLSGHNLAYANLGNTNLTNVQLPKNLSNVHLSGAKLPLKLSGFKFANAILTEIDFARINFMQAELAGVDLCHTTCGYVQCFLDNIKANNLEGGQWYIDHIEAGLKSIAQVYLNISSDSQKAELLKIASGFAYLPYYQGMEFTIKIAYWGSKLLIFKNQLNEDLKKMILFPLTAFSEDAQKYCWSTDYTTIHLEPTKGIQIASFWARITTGVTLITVLGSLVQSYLTEPAQTEHANFDQYFQVFQEGLVKYNVKSIVKIGGYDWYRAYTKKCIEGLKKAFPYLISPALQKEAINIAIALSESYKMAHFQLHCHYPDCQERLIRLRALAGGKAKKHIYAYYIFLTSFQKELWRKKR